MVQSRGAAVLLLCLVWSAGGAGGGGAQPCPAQCTCRVTDRGKKRVACTGGGMREPIPTASMDVAVEIVDITAPEDNYNNLTVGPLFQHFKQLEELQISRSNVPQVPMHAFWGVPSLKKLDLSHNRIRAVFDHNFRGLLNLLELDLDDNLIEELRSGAFRHLTELRVLSVRLNRLKIVEPRSFVKLARLRELRMSGNEFEELDPEAFKDVPDLRVLECRNCSLKRINTQIYHLLPYLTHLDLGNNRFQFISKDEFRDLHKLHTLKLDGNLLPVILEDTFVSQHQLKYLTLARNRIVKITDTAFKNLSSILDLDIGYNKMAKIESVALTHISESLQRLVISGNKFNMNTLKMVMDTLSKVVNLEVSHMKIESIRDNFFPDRIKYLNISLNNITELSPEMLPKKLTELDVSKNKIKGLNESVIVKLEVLKFVDISENPWTCDLCHITAIYLRSNKTKLFVNSTCAFPSYLKGRKIRFLGLKDIPSCEDTELNEKNAIENSKKGLIIGLICILCFLLFSIIFVVYSCVRRHSRNVARQQKRAAELRDGSVMDQATAVFCKEDISFKFPIYVTEKKMSVSTIDEIKKDDDHRIVPNGNAAGISSC